MAGHPGVFYRPVLVGRSARDGGALGVVVACTLHSGQNAGAHCVFRIAPVGRAADLDKIGAGGRHLARQRSQATRSQTLRRIENQRRISEQTSGQGLVQCQGRSTATQRSGTGDGVDRGVG